MLCTKHTLRIYAVDLPFDWLRIGIQHADHLWTMYSYVYCMFIATNYWEFFTFEISIFTTEFKKKSESKLLN